MPTSWPDVPAATSPKATVRDQLDYIAWISEVMEGLGSHAGPEMDAWRKRVQVAYSGLVDAMSPGHGDPLPPDVPPTVQPGSWPDVPSAGVPGMTVRHQLAVLRSIAANSRLDRLFPRAPTDVSTWTARVQGAFDALDHGPSLPMPEEARTSPPPPTPAGGAKAAGGARRAAKSKRAGGAKGAARKSGRARPQGKGRPPRRKR